MRLKIVAVHRITAELRLSVSKDVSSHLLLMIDTLL